MEISRLSGVGAEITGVDIRHLSDNEYEGIKSAFTENGLIFFRDQHLTEEDHIAFAKRWGEIDSLKRMTNTLKLPWSPKRSTRNRT